MMSEETIKRLVYLVDRMLEEINHNYFVYQKLRDEFDAIIDKESE